MTSRQFHMQIWVLALLALVAPKGHSEDLQSDIVIADHVLIQRNLSYSGDRLCQDQKYIYFKDEKSCQLENSEFSDCSDLKIAPIRQLEQIRYRYDSSVFRIFRINLEYRIRTYRKDESGENSYTLSENFKTKGVEFCGDDRPVQQAEVVTSSRDAYDELESSKLEDLDESGFSVFVSASGPIYSFEMVDQEGLNLSGFDRVNHSLFDLEISSPLCTRRFDPRDLHLVGGEFSGNSMPRGLFDRIYRFSDPIILKTEVSGGAVLECSVQEWI